MTTSEVYDSEWWRQWKFWQQQKKFMTTLAERNDDIRSLWQRMVTSVKIMTTAEIDVITSALSDCKCVPVRMKLKLFVTAQHVEINMFLLKNKGTFYTRMIISVEWSIDSRCCIADQLPVQPGCLSVLLLGPSFFSPLISASISGLAVHYWLQSDRVACSGRHPCTAFHSPSPAIHHLHLASFLLYI